MKTFKKRNLKAVTPEWSWVKEPGFGWVGGILEINGTPYGVAPTLGVAPGDETESIIGWRLWKNDGTVYDLDLFGVCDCADSTFNHERPGGCKHRVALKAALGEFGWVF